MDFFASDEFLVMFVPILVYWLYSGMYELLSSFDFTNNFRLHSAIDEQTKNLVTKSTVIKGVLLQQAIQATAAFLLSKLSSPSSAVASSSTSSSSSSFVRLLCQVFVAMFVMDTCQYFVHRCMHSSKFLYCRFHSWHHRLAAPYAFAAQYNHPVDGLLTETASGALAFFVSGMSARTAVVFFSFATVKGIDDHCGMVFPWNPFHVLFGNNTAYHDLHHQLAGGKYNFSQPFFVVWDRVFGTYVPCLIQKREGGGYQARIGKS